jgi:hypothetical protein
MSLQKEGKLNPALSVFCFCKKTEPRLVGAVNFLLLYCSPALLRPDFSLIGQYHAGFSICADNRNDIFAHFQPFHASSSY